MNAKKTKETADALLEQGIRTREQYLQAVPLIFEMQKAIKGASDWVALLKDRMNELSEGAASYAIDHTSALDEPLSVKKDGIESGTVEIGGETYRLTLSLDAPKRISGGNLTQDYLSGLPKDFVQKKLSLLTSALEGMSPDELARYDLKRDVKRVWSIAEAA